MSDWWYRNIIEPGKLPLLLALGAFVLTFLVTRMITRLIRAGRGPFRNISSGGTHIHHVVPGIILMTIGGFGGVASPSQGFGAGLSAVLFGAGAGLVLDEFALVLYLDDVYWSDRGRKSVEAVVVTFSVVSMMLLGLVPFGVDSVTPDEQQSRVSVILTIAVNFLFVLLALVKGKLRSAVLGVFVPFVALFAALRLARPDSLWAERLYSRRPRAAQRAEARAARHDARWAGPLRRLQDWLGGFTER
ncbi:hypothetical protein [Actinacidiphila glaucinigra]|uniref:hypothetical protein n=1 Tax=Actinacidiphila glaucinigra TaxID=235986 RepID=UPI002E3822BF|nr:hypothetical protein [Actinacidiphila glaucinigra]